MCKCGYIVYIQANWDNSAPMKALAAEIVRKLGKRLAWLSIKVRELTGRLFVQRRLSK